MKPTKPTTDDLKTQLFARRRYHEAGNRPADTIEKRQKRERIPTLLLWIGAIVFTLFAVTLWIYALIRDPLLDWLTLPAGFSSLLSILLWLILLLDFLSTRQSCGRWIIAFDGIFYRYGKSPHRFVPLASLRNIRVKKSKNGARFFSSIVFDTDQEPLRIEGQTLADNKPTDFLPFLNYLIDRLTQSGWSSADLTPLLELQRFYQRRSIFARCIFLRGFVFVLGGCGFLILSFGIVFLCKLYIIPHIINLPFPLFLFAVFAMCMLVVCPIAIVYFFQWERWKNKKIDAMIQTLAEGENDVA